ncbi:hypothetical protein [Streptomyces sp. NPDC056452]|uniref:hypothetical protein n=1 Tax=Streptomyces sp. NPDC056452 TaxID=3345821 RepID=UPI00368C33F1
MPASGEGRPGLAPDGTLVLFGYDDEPLSLPVPPMVLNRLHVMANPSGSPQDTRDTLAFSAAHGILPEITPVGLRDANAVLDAMAKGAAGSGQSSRSTDRPATRGVLYSSSAKAPASSRHSARGRPAPPSSAVST